MLHLLCAAALAAAPAIETARAPVEATLDARTTLAVVATPTSFAAHNISDNAKVLCFRSGGATRLRVLGPGASVQWSFARQQLAGVTLEVYELDGLRFAPQGSVALGALAQSGADALWFTQRAERQWVQFGRTLMPGSGNGAALLQAGGNGSAPLHVPVPAPLPRPRPARPVTRPQPI